MALCRRKIPADALNHTTNTRRRIRRTAARVSDGLYCDVIVQEISDGQVKVAAIDPLASILAAENPKLKKLAAEIGNKLKTVIART